MAMDFFDHQDRARRSTTRLVVLFALAVIATVVVLHVLIGAVFIVGGNWKETEAAQGAQATPLWENLLNWRILLGVTGSTLVVIIGGSLFKLAQLSAGGKVIAEQLGGKRLHQDTANPNERKLLNVIEEMSIASGVPMPPVYLMEQEKGINAFAAGFSPSDAVIGITRGTIENLSRDELQGVMAHEFSHILNGDMRLNLRLVGVLHGILLIALIGHTVMRIMFYTSYVGRRSKDEGSARMAVALIGVILMIVGGIGWFFGNWIKSAVSRQREFLADASAVQFTRNPEGIAGALKRILGHSSGAAIAHPHAAEASHMFFGSGVRSMFATHPPLPTRIKQIQPGWDGTLPEPLEKPKESEQPQPKQDREKMFRDMLGGAAAGAIIGESAGSGASLISGIGTIDQAHLSYARTLLDGLPEALREAAYEPYGARAVIYALLLSSDEQVRQGQLSHLAQHADAAVAKLTGQLVEPASAMDRAARLPLVDLTIGTLKELSPSQYEVFKANLMALVRADRKIDLFEWSLGRILLRHLDGEFTKVRPPRVKYYALGQLGQQCAVLLSALARVGHRDEAQAAQAVTEAGGQLGIAGVELLKKEDSGLDDLDRTLDTLKSVAPKAKRAIIDACSACVAWDRKVSVHEAELLRAIADGLDVPMPPLLPGQPLR